MVEAPIFPRERRRSRSGGTCRQGGDRVPPEIPQGRGDLDIFCYRRFGHNEGDEPMFTNPIMYKKIKTHKTTLSLYTERLVKDGLIPEGEIEDMKAAFQAHLNEEFEIG